MTTTTIAIQQTTHFMLSSLKEEYGMPNFDETIITMIGKLKKSEKSLFGSLPKLTEFKREEFDRFA